MSKPKAPQKKGALYQFLNLIEVVGNRLPHPILLFGILSLLVVILSALFSAIGLSATGTAIVDGEVQETTVGVISLLSPDGLEYMLTTVVTNFTSYAPLGVVLVAMLGVGVAEQSGLISVLLKGTVRFTPKALITPVIIFLGVMSNVASDVGYVVLIPLGAMVFRAYGRHPIAGLAAAFFGVSGGFSANLLVGSVDALLAGITQEAAKIVDPNYVVNVLGNYFFMFVSTFLVIIVGTIITDKLVEPRLGAYQADSEIEEDHSLREITESDKKGIIAAAIAAGVFLLVLAVAAIPENSFLRNENGEIIGTPTSPLIGSIVVIIMLGFFIPAIAFGKASGSMSKKSGNTVCNAMGKTMSSLGDYVALSFIAAQFIAYFNYSNIGNILAINGASFFSSVNIGLVPLIVMFVLFTAFINLFIGSASAKWNIMAPVFVPMFMLLGYSPELAQLAYRVGDSSTNIITPLLSYFVIIVVFAQKYDKKAGIGTLVSTMLPYSLSLLLIWIVMLVAWLLLGIPIGPGTSTFYTF